MHRYNCSKHEMSFGPLMVAMMRGGRHRGWGHGGGDSFDNGDWGGRHGRRPGGRSRVFGTGELRLVLLALVAEQARHGYELIKAIEDMTGGNYAPSPGVVYPTLNLLTDEGLIAELASDGARKAYDATQAGRDEIAQRGDDVERLKDRLRSLADDTDRHGAPPLRRAINNLVTAVRQRAAANDFSRETLHAVTDILDEAARKIERL